MKHTFTIQRYQEGKKGNFYTVHFAEEHAESEIDRFLDDSTYNQTAEFENLILRLQDLLNRYGFEKQYFKWEATSADSIGALHYDNGKLRLYCCRWTKGICIAGYGGIKNTRTYQEDPRLDGAVKRLEEVDQRLYQRIMEGDVRVGSKRLVGNLHFDKNDFI